MKGFHTNLFLQQPGSRLQDRCKARRRERSASPICAGWARFSTVLLNTTISSSCSRTKAPVSGWSCVFLTVPSLTHCQNCVCVVQNSLRSRQITRAVFFFFFFLTFLSFFWLFVLNAFNLPF